MDQSFGRCRARTSSVVEKLVDATNLYKKFIELDLIFDSPENFLYRQKGQLKLDNTILEEFLPQLVFGASAWAIRLLNSAQQDIRWFEFQLIAGESRHWGKAQSANQRSRLHFG